MALWMPTCPPRKAAAARVVGLTPLTRMRRHHETRRPLLRIFNLHSVPARYAGPFERLLEKLSERFVLAAPSDLERLVADGPGERSHAVLTFDDALANHAEIAAPILERRGARAIFCVPAAFPAVDAAAQSQWFRTHVYPVPTELHEPGELRAATWEQLAELAARGHRICSHGTLHTVLSTSTTARVVDREVRSSRAQLEAQLPGVAVDGFCWPGAAAPDAEPASAAIRATYAYSLGNAVRPLRGGDALYDLPRVNLEVSWPTEVVDLQLSGILDLRYALRR